VGPSCRVAKECGVNVIDSRYIVRSLQKMKFLPKIYLLVRSLNISGALSASLAGNQQPFFKVWDRTSALSHLPCDPLLLFVLSYSGEFRRG
jgi:hypothetical protein